MKTVDSLVQIWGVRATYPVTLSEFLSLLSEEGEKTWVVENEDNQDGTFTNEIHVNEHRYVIVTQQKIQNPATS